MAEPIWSQRALAAAFAHAPLAALLVWRLATGEFAIAGAGLVIAGYASAAYASAVAAIAHRDVGLVRACLSMPLYWPLATLAAGRAIIELATAPFYWAKTDHCARSRSSL